MHGFFWTSPRMKREDFLVFAGRVSLSNENMVVGVYSMLKGRRPARPDHPELSDRVWKMI